MCEAEFVFRGVLCKPDTAEELDSGDGAVLEREVGFVLMGVLCKLDKAEVLDSGDGAVLVLGRRSKT
jgi:hypothetical protein